MSAIVREHADVTDLMALDEELDPGNPNLDYVAHLNAVIEHDRAFCGAATHQNTKRLKLAPEKDSYKLAEIMHTMHDIRNLLVEMGRNSGALPAPVLPVTFTLATLRGWNDS